MTNSFRILACVVTVGLPLLVGALLFNWQVSGLPSPNGDSSAAGDPVHPVVTLDRTEHDFGRVPAGALLLAGFQVKNAGGKRLVVREQSRGCECVTGGRPEVIVPPGGSQDLTPGLDTKKLAGPLRTTIQYRTNDPNRPAITLVLLADVVPSPAVPEAAKPLEPIPLDGI